MVCEHKDGWILKSTALIHDDPFGFSIELGTGADVLVECNSCGMLKKLEIQGVFDL